MSSWKTSRVLRFLLVLLCVASASLSFWSGLLLAGYWNEVWSGANFFESGQYHQALYQYREKAYHAVELACKRDYRAPYVLSYEEQKTLDGLVEDLDFEHTNFRYQVHEEDGTLIVDGLEKGQTLDSLNGLDISEFSITLGYEARKDDRADDERGTLTIWLDEENIESFQALDCLDYNKYGWRFELNGYVEDDSGDQIPDGWWSYSSEYDTRRQDIHLTMEYGIVPNLPVDDAFRQAQIDYRRIVSWLDPAAICFLIAAPVFLLTLALYLASLGHRKGVEGVVNGWQERIPLDIYLFCDFWVLSGLVVFGDPIAFELNQGNPAAVIGVGVMTVIAAAFGLALLATVTLRLKTHTLWSNVLVFRLVRWAWRHLLELVRLLPMLWRVVLAFVGYAFLSILFVRAPLLFWLLQLIALAGICLWNLQWKRIRAATKQILSGDPNVKIDTKWMFHDLEQHAQELNRLSDSITAAVDQRLQSERFKAELITNVSHDLKTPLTSIINYVDLLKKQDITDPKALEYLEVLDRKSQRLKKLTEDLVEASKASTGALNVDRERLGYGQLVSQALGEYEEKFAAARLTLVADLPDRELDILADGRHLWRVIDNLLGNCCKYAMPGTRVYLSVAEGEGNTACFSLKNISREPLNVAPERLMERFVRGEESRTSDGSGLGLSIARSLTELQGGDFGLDIDGDLFKARVTFPLAPPAPIIPVPAEPQPPAEPVEPAPVIPEPVIPSEPPEEPGEPNTEV